MLSKEQLSELQSFVPNYREQLTSKHVVNLEFIESQFSVGGRNTYKKNVYLSYVQLLDAIPTLLDQGYSIDTVKSTQAKRNNLYPLVLNLNEKQVAEALEEALSLADMEFEKKVESLKALWANNELKEMIEDEKDKQIEAIKEQSEAKKKKLLSHLLTSV